MQELLNSLKEKAGISDEQANKVIQTIREFVSDKFPMAAGMLDKFFDSDSGGNNSGGEKKSGGRLLDILD